MTNSVSMGHRLVHVIMVARIDVLPDFVRVDFQVLLVSTTGVMSMQLTYTSARRSGTGEACYRKSCTPGLRSCGRWLSRCLDLPAIWIGWAATYIGIRSTPDSLAWRD